MRLGYVPKTALWGGDTLKKYYGKTAPFDKLAETWEVSVREDAQSLVENGEACGMTLGEYIEQAGYDTVSPDYDGKRFPLLIKFIDAEDDLSVQVHPTDDYAFRNEKDPGKTEMWYIVEAKEGAEIIYGLEDGVSTADFADALQAGELARVMHRTPVRKGECYFIPAGMLHAIGRGIVVAEIQQNSDLTYRVYDYDRRDANGNLRPLHVEKAMDVTAPFHPDDINRLRFCRNVHESSLLCACAYFRVNRVKVSGHVQAEADSTSFRALICVDGGGSIRFEGESYPIVRGNTYFLPAGMGEYDLYGDMTVLEASV